MPTRAAIVLLLVLNLGAAAWWLLHAPPPAEAPPATPAGAARLHLVEDASAAAAPAAARVQPNVAAPTPTPVQAQADTSAVAPPVAPAAARAEPAAPVVDANPGASIACEGGAGDAAGWRVYLPKLPSASAAQAMAARIGEAGFSDYLAVRDGDDANSIALGRYGTEPAAQRRTASLRAAGFPARCARIPPATPA